MPAAMAEIVKKELEKLPADARPKSNDSKIWRAPGCDACKNKGIMGRLAIFEVLRMTPELENIISSGMTEQKILEESRRQGMVTMRQDGILKAFDGLVSMEEVLRETEEI